MKKEEFMELKKRLETEEPTHVIHIEGIGTIQAYGELDFEKLIETLLKSKYIIGENED